jgi:phosphohistidine phosphatase
MKRLAVLRHAHSAAAATGVADFDRSLDAHGRQAARRIGEELRRRGLDFEHMIASPAVRVRETVDEIADGLGKILNVEFESSIYEANVDDLLRVVREIPDHAAASLLVGHNPGVHALLLHLARDDASGRRQRILGSFPTAALAIVALPTETWSNAEPGSGEIVELIVRRDLNAEN